VKAWIVDHLETWCGYLDHFHGLGCRIGLANLSDRLDQHWGTGVWK